MLVLMAGSPLSKVPIWDNIYHHFSEFINER